ncbi:MAG TPA: DNA polymerase III subunit delta [Phnomibacter sp.]|nr:DNA polymerase III subunit delta [Phnomibacter sp.]
MAPQNIIESWKKGKFSAVCWLEGDEPFFIDQVVEYAEKQILTEAEAGFNLSIFYGKDADWAAVVNACRRYPMFAERQVVILKEAQQMRDMDWMEGYLENPTPSTVLVVSYKNKKVDGRTKLAKLLKERGTLLTTSKMYDDKLPDWLEDYVRQIGYTITAQAANLMVNHIGNDLSRLANEVHKLTINVQATRQITDDDVEKYVGISKEFNAFELQHAITQRNMMRCLQIIQYFESNPKAMPIQQLLPTLYSFFSKAYLVFGAGTNNEYELAKALGYRSMNPYVKDIITCARNFRQKGVEEVLLLLHEYNLKSIGILSHGQSDAALMKEMLVRMIYPEGQRA